MTSEQVPLAKRRELVELGYTIVPGVMDIHGADLPSGQAQDMVRPHLRPRC